MFNKSQKAFYLKGLRFFQIHWDIYSSLFDAFEIGIFIKNFNQGNKMFESLVLFNLSLPVCDKHIWKEDSRPTFYLETWRKGVAEAEWPKASDWELRLQVGVQIPSCTNNFSNPLIAKKINKVLSVRVIVICSVRRHVEVGLW